jgi:UDP-N-acetylglucosamine 1-carboxyvinyltransferase
LPILAAVLLANSPVTLLNVPHLNDITTMNKLLASMGVAITGTNGHGFVLDSNNITDFTAPYDLVKTMRASILVLGPMLARYGVANVSFPAAAQLVLVQWIFTCVASKPWAPKLKLTVATFAPHPKAA